MQHIPIQLFALARDLAGADQITVALPEEATVADLRIRLFDQVPALGAVGDKVRFAVDQQYASDETPLSGAREVALIPPVSGG